jgi:Tol biopolymer transport system component/DNA-binding winged helix-turn-helix (wHTH) protein
MQEIPQSAPVFRFGVFEADLASGELRNQGSKIRLQEQPFRILVMLLDRAGEVVSRDEICRDLWPADTFVDFEQGVGTAIKKLRQALHDDAERPRYIETLPKRGFRFIAAVEKPAGPGALPYTGAAAAQAKEPEQRCQTPVASKDELASAAETHAPARFVRRKSRVWMGWAVAAAICIAAGFFAHARFRSETNVSAIRFVVPVPFNRSASVGAPSISPNGRLLAFVAPDARSRDVLWVRPLDGLSLRALPGTEDASFPFWSPDSRSLGFFSTGKLRKIAVTGGLPQVLCDVLIGWGGTWNPSGAIVFASSNRGPLYQVSASGGTVTPVTTLDRSRGDSSHAWPQFLPDGRHFLYLVRSGTAESTGAYIGSLDSKASKLLVHTGFGVAYAPPQQRSPGYLLFLSNGALMTQRIDIGKLHITGEPVALVQSVDGTVLGVGGPPSFSVSENGVLAYVTASATNTRLVWMDRKGNELGAIGPPGAYDHAELSPDETRVAVDRGDPRTGNRDIWLVDIARSAISRFTFDPASAWVPAWSPDGSRVLFVSERDGTSDLYQKAATAGAKEEALFGSETPKHHSDWSPDGRFIAYENEDSPRNVNIWVLPLFGDRKPIPLARTGFSEMYPRFSPDGKWIAYASVESGEFEVYVQSFPAMGVKREISTNGGIQPRWRGDGKELFYIEGRKIMVVEVKPGARFEVGMPKFLFEMHMSGADPRHQYTVTAEGQRFLVNTPITEPVSSPTILANWDAALKRRD